MKLLSRTFFFGHGSNLLNVLGHPYFISRFHLRRSIKKYVPSRKQISVLDLGCGSMPYKDLFENHRIYSGMEINQIRNQTNENVEYFYDGTYFPPDTPGFDCILCSQVLEHSFTPDIMLEEIFKHLKPNGELIITTPFMWPEHEQPYDSQRFTSFGLVHRLQKAGFGVLTPIKCNPGLNAIFQLTIEQLEEVMRPLIIKSKTLHLAWRFLTFIPYTTINFLSLISLFCSSSSKNTSSSFYLDLVIKATKPAT